MNPQSYFISSQFLIRLSRVVFFCFLSFAAVLNTHAQDDTLYALINQMRTLEGNRDPKCHATANRLVDFIYGTPLDGESRILNNELQKSFLRLVWTLSEPAKKASGEESGGGAVITPERLEEASKDIMPWNSVEEGFEVTLPSGELVKISLRDFEHYSSIAYCYRSLLAITQESSGTLDSQGLPQLDEPSAKMLAKIGDLFALSLLQIADRKSREENSYMITPDILKDSFAETKFVFPQWVSENIDIPSQEGDFQTLRLIIAAKKKAYEVYNKINIQVFIRNLQVHFARFRWPSSEIEKNEFKQFFTESMAVFVVDLLHESEQHAKENSERFIREKDVLKTVNEFMPHIVNQYEDVVYFPGLGKGKSFTIEAYDLDAFRDSGLHWMYLEYALDHRMFNGSLEPDPFAAEMIVEYVAQLAVAVLRLAGEYAEESKAEYLTQEHLLAGFQRYQALLVESRNATTEQNQSASIVSTERKQSRVDSQDAFFVDNTEHSGISFEHRSAAWVNRLLRSYLKSGENVGNLTIAPAFGGSGVASEDLDQDGDMDLLLLSGLGNRIYLNDGSGIFSDATDQSGIENKRSDGTFNEPRQPIIADFDNDGIQDILITFVASDHKLFRGIGGGKFEDVSSSSNLGGEDGVAGPAVVFDYDNDGLLDIYIGYFGNYTRSVLPTLNRVNLNADANRLYRNLGDFVFEDVTESSRTGNTGWAQAMAHTDLDGDGLQDIIVGNDFGVNAYYRNKGDGTFEEISGEIGTDKPSFTMNVGITDLNDDLLPDIYISNIVTMIKDDKYVMPSTETQAHLSLNSLSRMRVVDANDLFLSTRVDDRLSTYVHSNDVVERGLDSTGWSWGAEFFDFDLDGDEDLFCLNGMNDFYVYSVYSGLKREGKEVFYAPASKAKNVFFVNDSGKLKNFTDKSGLGIISNSRSQVHLDIDSDGDLDVVTNDYHGPARVFLNNNTDGNWLKVTLEGDPETGSNRDAIGAKLIVTAGDLQVWREIRGGGGYLSCQPKEQHFGLGDESAFSLKIIWPNGQEEEIDDLSVNRRYHFKQNR